MKSLRSLVLLLVSLRCASSMSCTYGGRGSLMSTCVEATPIYFRTTSYRFDNLDETVRCLNCVLTVIESNTFDISGNRINTLDLTKSQISVLKPKSFVGLMYLKKLLLPGNRITTVPALTFLGINRIEYLDVQNNTITSLVSDGFKELVQLKQLFLQNNYIKVIEKGAFNGLTSLEVLDLTNNHVDVIDGVFNTPNLGRLSLKNNNVKEIQPNDLSEVGNLIELDLSGNQMKSIPEGAFITLPRLESLNLSTNPIDALSVNAFRGLNSLEDLDLSAGKLAEIPKGALLFLHRLRDLNLSYNKMVQFKTGLFGGLPELRKLNLSHNSIESYVKTGLFPLQTLHTLDLSHNKLEDLDFKLLVDHLPALSYIELRDNPLRCYIAKEMEEEFKHDNLKFNLGPVDYEEVKCNDSRPADKDTYVAEAPSASVQSDGHEYVLYVFMFVSLGLMAYLFFLQFKNQKDIRDLLGSTSVSEAQLLRSSDTNARDDY